MRHALEPPAGCPYAAAGRAGPRRVPLADPELRFVAHGENTTFRVDATALDGRARFLLRVHRPARHGRHVDSAAAVRSELDWLTALRADTGLSVPEPFRTTDGNLTTVATSGDAPEPRVCSVLRWMDGRARTAAPRPVHLYRLGSVMERLHNHASQWRVPPGFVRIRWDWETFFGDTMIYGESTRLMSGTFCLMTSGADLTGWLPHEASDDPAG